MQNIQVYATYVFWKFISYCFTLAFNGTYSLDAKATVTLLLNSGIWICQTALIQHAFYKNRGRWRHSYSEGTWMVFWFYKENPGIQFYASVFHQFVCFIHPHFNQVGLQRQNGLTCKDHFLFDKQKSQQFPKVQGFSVKALMNMYWSAFSEHYLKLPTRWQLNTMLIVQYYTVYASRKSCT